MDILFLLDPNFTDAARDSEGKRYYCSSCAFLEGVLHYCPELREKLDIRYIEYRRPRREIIELVGDANEGCPNLVIDARDNGGGITLFGSLISRPDGSGAVSGMAVGPLFLLGVALMTGTLWLVRGFGWICGRVVQAIQVARPQ